MEAYLEWLSSNELINYPFKENVPLQSTLGISLQKNLLIDIVIYGLKVEDRAFLSKVNSVGATVTLTFSSINEGEILTFIIDKNSDSIRELFEQENGTIIGRLLPGEGLLNLGTETHIFTLANTELEPSVLIPFTERVFKLTHENSEFENDIQIGEGVNMEVEIDDENVLRFNAGPGFGLGSLIGCFETIEPKVIKTINGKGPNENNNFKIQGSDCIEARIFPDINMVLLYDHCRSCCDCDNLNTLQITADDLESRIEVLEGP